MCGRRRGARRGARGVTPSRATLRPHAPLSSACLLALRSLPVSLPLLTGVRACGPLPLSLSLFLSLSFSFFLSLSLLSLSSLSLISAFSLLCFSIISSSLSLPLQSPSSPAPGPSSFFSHFSRHFSLYEGPFSRTSLLMLRPPAGSLSPLLSSGSVFSLQRQGMK